MLISFSMSQRKAKKIRQLYRRDVRANMKEARDIVENIFKDKPKYVPTFFWRFLIKLVIEKKYLDLAD